MEPSEQCRMAIDVRDTYRRTGRGKSGFEMHYRRQQCSRRGKYGGYCKTHYKMLKAGWNMLDFSGGRSVIDKEADDADE